MSRDTIEAERFAIVPEWLLNDLSVPSDAIRIYGFLRRYADKEGHARPFRKTLAERLGGCTLRHIDRMVNHLERVHALEVQTRTLPGNRGHMASHYCLLSLSEKMAKDEAEQQQKEADERSTSVVADHHNPVGVATVESLGGDCVVARVATVESPPLRDEREPLNESHGNTVAPHGGAGVEDEPTTTPPSPPPTFEPKRKASKSERKYSPACQALTREIWDAADPKPLCGFPRVLIAVGNMLGTGYSEQAIRQVAKVTAGWSDAALQMAFHKNAIDPKAQPAPPPPVYVADERSPSDFDDLEALARYRNGGGNGLLDAGSRRLASSLRMPDMSVEEIESRKRVIQEQLRQALAEQKGGT
jgi:hypothetical protein